MMCEVNEMEKLFLYHATSSENLELNIEDFENTFLYNKIIDIFDWEVETNMEREE